MSSNSSQQLPACPAVGSQSATICLPVSIKPYAVAGPAKIECCGNPMITSSCANCHGIPNGRCDFTISQTIRIDLPVEFGATISTGETYVDCFCDENGISQEDCGDLKAMELDNFCSASTLFDASFCRDFKSATDSDDEDPLNADEDC